MTAPLLELRQIARQFPGTLTPGVLANDAISLTLHPGTVTVLLGENGAGKSTLAKILSGADQPTGGDIRVDGRRVALRSPAAAAALGIGAVQQHALLVPTLTVAENLLLGGRWWRNPPRAAAAARFAADCRKFGLAIDPQATVADLSLAEQRYVEIIRALWRGSRILVLDEPTAMLGPAASRQLPDIFATLKRDGVAVVFVTHSLDEARDAADRILVLRRGRLVGELSRAAPEAQIRALMFGETAAEPARERTSATARPALQVSGLSLRDSDGARRLHDIGFTVHAGEILGVAGIEGHGQRELAEAVAGQRQPDAGHVTLDGRALDGLGVAARYRLGLRYLSDDRLGEGSVGAFPLAINLLLKQIGAPPFWRAGIDRRAAMEAHAERLIAAYDVRTPGPWTAIGKLSGGNVQKAMLARELDGAARAIVFNKPTIGLDLHNAAAIRARIRAAAAAGIAAVVISADLDELFALADRIGVLSGGRLAGIVAAGAPDARARVEALMTGRA